MDIQMLAKQTAIKLHDDLKNKVLSKLGIDEIRSAINLIPNYNSLSVRDKEYLEIRTVRYVVSTTIRTEK